jgi:hypothetical protein
VIARRDPLLPRRWRRFPVGIATDASLRRVDLEALLQPGIREIRRRVTADEPPCPLVRSCSLGLRSADLDDVVTVVSVHDLLASMLRVPRRDDPQRVSVISPDVYP